MAVSEDASVDEAVPIDIRKERNTKSYKETTSKDIGNINTYETRTKFNTEKWRPIYEVIDEAYIEDSRFFPDDLIGECIVSVRRRLFERRLWRRRLTIRRLVWYCPISNTAFIIFII